MKRELSAWGYNWATLLLGDINTQTWYSRLDARLMTLHCKKITVAKSKEVRTGWSNLIDKSGRIFKGRLWLKKGCFVDDDDHT
jgi:hypothetical protein